MISKFYEQQLKTSTWPNTFKSLFTANKNAKQWHFFWSVLGLFLLIAYIQQLIFQLHWPWLAQLQQNSTYQFMSGLVLGLHLLTQWLLFGLRVRSQRHKAKSWYQLHYRLGALAPLFFYAHAAEPGYNYLAILSISYLSNLAVALFNPTAVQSRHPTYRFGWLTLHIALSLLVLLLTLLHAYIASYYH